MLLGKVKRNSYLYAFILCSLMMPIVLGGACQGGKSENTISENKQNFNSGPPRPASQVDSGDFKLRYQTPKNVHNTNPSLDAILDKQALERIVTSLNGRVALPVDVDISFENCEGADAFYELHKVTICYELIDEYLVIFGLKVKEPEKLKRTVKGATVATLFHELGHALIDVWKLPATGKEEDAADQLATLALMSRSETGEEMALYGAVSFQLYADLEKEFEKIYWDQHSLDEQRFYDTICLIYGQHPDKYDYLIKDGTLPEERARYCPEEFSRAKQAWQTLLNPYLK